MYIDAAEVAAGASLDMHDQTRVILGLADLQAGHTDPADTTGVNELALRRREAADKLASAALRYWEAVGSDPRVLHAAGVLFRNTLEARGEEVLDIPSELQDHHYNLSESAQAVVLGQQGVDAVRSAHEFSWAALDQARANSVGRERTTSLTPKVRANASLRGAGSLISRNAELGEPYDAKQRARYWLTEAGSNQLFVGKMTDPKASAESLASIGKGAAPTRERLSIMTSYALANSVLHEQRNGLRDLALLIVEPYDFDAKGEATTLLATYHMEARVPGRDVRDVSTSFGFLIGTQNFDDGLYKELLVHAELPHTMFEQSGFGQYYDEHPELGFAPNCGDRLLIVNLPVSADQIRSAAAIKAARLNNRAPVYGAPAELESAIKPVILAGLRGSGEQPLEILHELYPEQYPRTGKDSMKAIAKLTLLHAA